MADKNSSNKRKNVTGAYPGVTGSYRSKSSYPNSAPKNVTARSESVKNNNKKNNDKFDFKLWFSSDNVQAFLKQLRFYGICVALALLFTAGIISVANDAFAFIKPDETIVVNIEQGASTSAIGKALKKAGVIDHPFVFRLYSKLKHADGKYQYGDYSLNSNLGYDQIISKLKKASVQAETYTVTIPEGSTQDEIIEILTASKNRKVSITDLENALNNYEFDEYEFVKELPSRRCRLEGYLPYGEYEFYVGESAVSMVEKMLERFKETVLTEQNSQLITASGMKLDEVITLASLIEAECDSKDMYKGAAAVLFNRLKSETDNFLQLTSSINYALPSPKTTFTETDKRTESEYNTYLYSGLPKGPVCNPSIDAVNAVLSPESSAYLYFISDGEKSYFSSTLEEHNSNLKKAAKTAKGTNTIK